MTLIVNQLETFDKSNLEMIRIEFFKLQKKLEEYQKEQEFLKPDIGKSIWIFAGESGDLQEMATSFSFLSQATAITQALQESASQW